MLFHKSNIYEIIAYHRRKREYLGTFTLCSFSNNTGYEVHGAPRPGARGTFANMDTFGSSRLAMTSWRAGSVDTSPEKTIPTKAFAPVRNNPTIEATAVVCLKVYC